MLKNFSINLIRVVAAMFLSCCAALYVEAQSRSVENINFQFAQTDTLLVSSLSQNRTSLSRLAALSDELRQGSRLCVDSIIIDGWSSPEGTVTQNAALSSGRQNVVLNLLKKYNIASDKTPLRKGGCGIAWHELAQKLSEDNPDYAPEILQILNDAPQPGRLDTRKKRLMEHNYGRTWHKMLADYFPALRHASALIYLSSLPEPEPVETVQEENEIIEITKEPAEQEDTLATLPAEDMGKKFYMSLSTNMLYDVAALPNLSLEFYLGKQFSVTGNWMYGWWDSKTKNRFWRAYGGMIAGRYWFGRKAKEKPLTGHHLGVYAQALIYDFEWGGKGYLGGTPGHNIFDHPTIGAGLEYGFALPISRRLNIDFNIGVGYLGGRYYEYEPKDDHYVWLRTKRRNWFGPTKLEVNLVWLIGNGNYNRKGGKK